MDVVRALVGVDCLEIAQHPHHVEFVGNSIAAVHVARRARDLERLAAIVALEERNCGRRGPALLEQPAQPQRRMEAQRDLRLHIGELLLNELVGGKGTAEEKMKAMRAAGITVAASPAALGTTMLERMRG